MRKKYFRSFLEISQCFDTLTEFIQGPCAANQKAIIDSKFLEIAAKLLSLDERSNSLLQYEDLIANELRSAKTLSSQFDEKVELLNGWMISHLKYKCMITILSLLEGRKDKYAVTRMIRVFSMDIFKENLVSIYTAYLELYGEGYYDIDIFNHHEENESYLFGSLKNP